MNQKWVIVWKTVQHNMVMDSNENIGYILYIMYSVNVGAFFWPWRAYVFYVKYSRPGKFSPFGWSILFFSYVIFSFCHILYWKIFSRTFNQINYAYYTFKFHFATSNRYWIKCWYFWTEYNALILENIN